MVGNQRPGKTGLITAAKYRPQAIQKPLPIRVVKKYLAARDPLHDDMMQCAGRIDA